MVTNDWNHTEQMDEGDDVLNSVITNHSVLEVSRWLFLPTWILLSGVTIVVEVLICKKRAKKKEQ